MEWCYIHYLNNTKPKGIIKRIIYKIFLWCGVSPSKIFMYGVSKNFKLYEEEEK